MRKSKNDKNYENKSKVCGWYDEVHRWVRKRKPVPERCRLCGKTPEKSLHCSNTSGLYLYDIDDYEYICHACHGLKDLKPEVYRKIKDLLEAVKHED